MSYSILDLFWIYVSEAYAARRVFWILDLLHPKLRGFSDFRLPILELILPWRGGGCTENFQSKI